MNNSSLLNVSNNNHTFIEMLKPEPGYEIKQMIGTSYSLNLEWLLELFYFLRGHSDDYALENNSEDFKCKVLDFIDFYAEKTRIFIESGRIKPFQNSYDSVFENYFRETLNKVVVEYPPKNRTFHPKVWIVHYEPRENNLPRINKLFVMSKNAISYPALDYFAVFENEFDESTPINKELRDFLTHLKKETNLSDNDSFFEDDWEETFARISLPENANFFSQYPVEKSKFSGNKIIEKITGKNEDYAKKLAVISPFLGKRVINEFSGNKQIEDFYLISREKELAESLDLDSYQKIAEKCFYITNIDNYLKDSEIQPDDPGGDFDVLHAKIYIIERLNGGVEIIIGSGNCTSSGIKGNNVEAMVSISLADLDFDQIVHKFIFTDKDEQQLQPYLEKFTDLELIESDETEDESDAEKILKDVISFDWIAAYEDGELILSVKEEGNFERQSEIEISIVDTSKGGIKLEYINQSWSRQIAEDRLSSLFKFRLGEEEKYCFIDIIGIDRQKFIEKRKSEALEGISDYQRLEYLFRVLLGSNDHKQSSLAKLKKEFYDKNKGEGSNSKSTLNFFTSLINMESILSLAIKTRAEQKEFFKRYNEIKKQQKNEGGEDFYIVESVVEPLKEVFETLNILEGTGGKPKLS